MLSITTMTKKVGKTAMLNKDKPLLFDLTEETIDTLGDIIGLCVETKVDLICFSKNAMKQPEISLTKIVGLKDLFIQACLQHGLLGYLDWKNENTPNEQNTNIMTNVIIITCGKQVVEITDSNGEDNRIAHEVDEKRLAFIRERSRVKFNQITHKI